MRLPSHVLLKLCLASTATIGCEQARQAAPLEPPPTAVERSTESLGDQFHVAPAVAPRFAQPQPQPQPQQQPQPQPEPQPQIKVKPKRTVQVSMCGHPAPLAPSRDGITVVPARCGRG